MTTNNIWLGCNELVILFRNGTHVVVEAYEEYNEVFQGTYKECVDYCEKRWLAYEMSIIG